MVFGGSGTGKTTFLRKVGLEALKQAKGEYSHSSIPVLLELRKFSWEKSAPIDLAAKIAEEFENCGLSEDQAFTHEFLEQGRLLILLDGLDQVPTELLTQMTTAIQQLVDRYQKNRFIVSCRIAADHSCQNFSRFTSVTIADFDEQQIQSFINSWFKSHSQPEWGQKCWSILASGDHQMTRELVKTPLLLTLICSLFLKHGKFPTKRSTLYDRAVSMLLTESDDPSEVIDQQTSPGLEPKCQEIILAEIAYTNFIADRVFFSQGEITKQIEQTSLEILPDNLHLNGRNILSILED